MLCFESYVKWPRDPWFWPPQFCGMATEIRYKHPSQGVATICQLQSTIRGWERRSSILCPRCCQGCTRDGYSSQYRRRCTRRCTHHVIPFYNCFDQGCEQVQGEQRPPHGAGGWALPAKHVRSHARPYCSPTVGAWPRTRTLAVQHREPSGPSPPPLRSPLRPSLFRRARTLSVEAPVHGPEVLCLYVILALLEIYNHFRQSHARQLMSVYRYTGD